MKSGSLPVYNQTMETNHGLVVVTYGELNAVQYKGETLTSFVIGECSLARARELALEFIHVIPDDLEEYQRLIADWNGEHPLEITHQDDDFFFLNITVSHLTGADTDNSQDLEAFRAFVAANNADP